MNKEGILLFGAAMFIVLSFLVFAIVTGWIARAIEFVMDSIDEVVYFFTHSYDEFTEWLWWKSVKSEEIKGITQGESIDIFQQIPEYTSPEYVSYNDHRTFAIEKEFSKLSSLQNQQAKKNSTKLEERWKIPTDNDDSIGWGVTVSPSLLTVNDLKKIGAYYVPSYSYDLHCGAIEWCELTIEANKVVNSYDELSSIVKKHMPNQIVEDKKMAEAHGSKVKNCLSYFNVVCMISGCIEMELKERKMVVQSPVKNNYIPGVLLTVDDLEFIAFVRVPLANRRWRCTSTKNWDNLLSEAKKVAKTCSELDLIVKKHMPNQILKDQKLASNIGTIIYFNEVGMLDGCIDAEVRDRSSSTIDHQVKEDSVVFDNKYIPDVFCCEKSKEVAQQEKYDGSLTIDDLKKIGTQWVPYYNHAYACTSEKDWIDLLPEAKKVALSYDELNSIISKHMPSQISEDHKMALAQGSKGLHCLVWFNVVGMLRGCIGAELKERKLVEQSPVQNNVLSSKGLTIIDLINIGAVRVPYIIRKNIYPSAKDWNCLLYEALKVANSFNELDQIVEKHMPRMIAIALDEKEPSKIFNEIGMLLGCIDAEVRDRSPLTIVEKMLSLINKRKINKS